MRERVARLAPALEKADASLVRRLRHDTEDVAQLRRSIESFGFGYLNEAIAPRVLSRLQDEAMERLGSAAFAQRTEGVRYQARIAPLGPEGEEFLFGSELLDLLFSVLGERFLPTEQSCCITYYREGDHLGLHRDQPAEECAVTTIAYLAAHSPSPVASDSGLNLHVYGQEMGDGVLRMTIPTIIGAVVIGRGSKFWHERPTLKNGEHVTALTGCYRHAL